MLGNPNCWKTLYFFPWSLQYPHSLERISEIMQINPRVVSWISGFFLCLFPLSLIEQRYSITSQGMGTLKYEI